MKINLLAAGKGLFKRAAPMGLDFGNQHKNQLAMPNIPQKPNALNITATPGSLNAGGKLPQTPGSQLQAPLPRGGMVTQNFGKGWEQKLTNALSPQPTANAQMNPQAATTDYKPPAPPNFSMYAGKDLPPNSPNFSMYAGKDLPPNSPNFSMYSGKPSLNSPDFSMYSGKDPYAPQSPNSPDFSMYSGKPSANSPDFSMYSGKDPYAPQSPNSPDFSMYSGKPSLNSPDFSMYSGKDLPPNSPDFSMYSGKEDIEAIRQPFKDYLASQDMDAIRAPFEHYLASQSYDPNSVGDPGLDDPFAGKVNPAFADVAGIKSPVADYLNKGVNALGGLGKGVSDATAFAGDKIRGGMDAATDFLAKNQPSPAAEPAVPATAKSPYEGSRFQQQYDRYQRALDRAMAEGNDRRAASIRSNIANLQGMEQRNDQLYDRMISGGVASPSTAQRNFRARLENWREAAQAGEPYAYNESPLDREAIDSDLSGQFAAAERLGLGRFGGGGGATGPSGAAGQLAAAERLGLGRFGGGGGATGPSGAAGPADTPPALHRGEYSGLARRDPYFTPKYRGEY